MTEMKVDSVEFEKDSDMGIVLLEDMDRRKVLPIWMGMFEAQAILFRMKKMSFTRPMTHDLLKNTVESLQARVEYILISDILENTYYAQIHTLQKTSAEQEKKVVIDARPSDAIALALRADAPIYLSDKVMEHTWDKDKFAEHQKSQFYKNSLEDMPDDELPQA